MTTRDDVNRILEWGGGLSTALKEIEVLINDPTWHDDLPVDLLDAIESILEDVRERR